MSPRLRVPLALLATSLVLAGAVLLDGRGVVEIDHRLTMHRSLAANLVLYGLVAGGAVLAWGERRRLAAYAAARRAALLVAVLSLATSLIGAELLLDRLDVPPERKRFHLIYSTERHHENPVDTVSYDNGGHRIRTNADGFRSPWTPEEFRGHATRIAVLGDSYLFGVNLDEERIVTSKLQAILRERLPEADVAVLNTGVISYSPLLERTMFDEHVAKYRPTHVVLFLDGNDIGDDYKYELYSSLGADGVRRFDVTPLPEPPVPLRLTRLARPLLDRLEAPLEVLHAFFPRTRVQGDFYQFELELGGVVETNRWFILRHPLEETRPYFERTFEHVRAIAAKARALGARFVVYVSPRYFHWSDRECPDNWAGSRYALDEPYEYAYFDFFEEKAREVDFPVVSLLPAFQATDLFPLVFRDDPHWNATGHQFVAETVAAHLLSTGLVP